VHHWGPFFEEDGKNASEGGQLALEVPLGGSVHLNCRVGMLHDKTVSTGAISNNLSGVKKHRTNLRATFGRHQKGRRKMVVFYQAYGKE